MREGRLVTQPEKRSKHDRSIRGWKTWQHIPGVRWYDGSPFPTASIGSSFGGPVRAVKRLPSTWRQSWSEKFNDRSRMRSSGGSGHARP